MKSVCDFSRFCMPDQRFTNPPKSIRWKKNMQRLVKVNTEIRKNTGNTGISVITQNALRYFVVDQYFTYYQSCKNTHLETR